ncbi:MAG: ABC transporter permease [Egibacteraceae bacterium]
MRRAMRSVVRMSAFLRKELVETLRQPRLVAALVLAPFLILLVFGAGLKDHDPAVATVFVVPEGDALADQIERFATEPSWRLDVEAVTPDRAQALARLQRGDLDVVIEFPADAEETVREDRQATVTIYHNVLDPIESRALGLATRAAVDRLNRLVLRSWVAEGQERAGDMDARLAVARDRVDAIERAIGLDEEADAAEQLALLQGDVAALSLGLALLGQAGPAELVGESPLDEQSVGRVLADLEEALDEVDAATAAESGEFVDIAQDLLRLDRALAEFQTLSPETIVDPFRGSLRRVATVPVGLADFFAPGVLVLLLQHMLVTLVGLSVVRDEQLGTTELFRVSPLSAGEVLIGKYLAYLLLSGTVAALLILLMVNVLGVPLAGSVALLVASLAAVMFTSIGMGFLVALLSRTDSQAVQYAMLLLLASIFLTGFLVSLERVVPAVQAAAWALPPTYGIALLRDVMLGGTPLQPRVFLGLVGIGAGLLAIGWWLLRRRLAPAGGRSLPRPLPTTDDADAPSIGVTTG